MNSRLTLAIVTKGRPQKLARCLESIKGQALLPEIVFVIDNDRNKTALPLVEKFSSLNIKYFIEKKGVLEGRNQALRNSKTKYLGFVDDDCVLDRRWVVAGTKKLEKEITTTYVIGRTKLVNKKNLIAQAQQRRDTYWKLKTLKKGHQTSRFHFDTKNVIFRRKEVMEKKIKFDPKCSVGAFDSGDFDFGINLDSKSLKGVYLEKMFLYHEETQSLIRFIKRAYYRGVASGVYKPEVEAGEFIC